MITLAKWKWGVHAHGLVLWAPLLVWLAAWSLLALLLCGMDKASARKGGRRISERTLLLTALVGGSLGLLLGMILFRHKTRKASFLGSFFLILIAQGVLAYAAWPLVTA